MGRCCSRRGCCARRRARKYADSRWPAGVLYAEPLKGVDIIAPPVAPLVTDVLLGYTVVPKRKFSTAGYLATGVMAVVCWPLLWIPAVMGRFYKPVQMPVYGAPGSAQPGPFTPPLAWGGVVDGYPAPTASDLEKGLAPAGQDADFKYDYPAKPATPAAEDKGSNPELKEPLL